MTTAIDGGEVTVTRGDQPMVVPFRVEDGDGGAATASIYVPAADSGLPFVEPDALIRLKPGQEREVDVADYVTNPSGGPVSLTFKNRIWTSPRTEVEASVVDGTHFRVSAADDVPRAWGCRPRGHHRHDGRGPRRGQGDRVGAGPGG